MERNKGKIITVTSTKGGVGKTITTLNLAGVFCNLKKKVLVIDFDLYGGAVSTYLNSKNDKTLFNLITDLSNNKYQTIDDYIYKHNESLSARPVHIRYLPETHDLPARLRLPQNRSLSS